MRGRRASLAERLPYWAVLEQETGDVEHTRAAFVVLKDGSLALGLSSPGLDLTGADVGRVEALAAQWGRALSVLPSGGYLQADFETGGDYGALVAAFASSGHSQAHPLLVRGRAEQARVLRGRSDVVRARLTYWFGLRGRLQAQLRAAGEAAGSAALQAALQASCVELWGCVADARAALAAGGLATEVLDAAAIERRLLAACAPSAQRARRPGGPHAAVQTEADQRPTLVPTPTWDAPTLDERLARASLRCASDHMELTPSLAAGEPQQLRVVGMHELPSATQADMLHAWLFEAAGEVPMRVSITHEMSDQKLQRMQLQQRRKLLFALVGRFFPDHEAKQAYAQTEQVLEQMANNDARVVRTSLAVVLGPAAANAQVGAARRLVEVADRHGLGLHPCEDAQLDAWVGTLPAHGYAAPFSHRLLHENASHLVPVVLPSEGDATADLVLGNRQKGLSKLAVRLGQRHDASAIVVGKTGSGKTFLFSWLAKYGFLSLGGHVVVADNKGPKNSSYRPLCALLGGDYVHLKQDEKVAFSPFPLPSEVRDGADKILPARLEGLESILFMMTEDARSALHPDYARNVVRRVALQLYENRDARDPAPLLQDAAAAARSLPFDNASLSRTAATVAERLQLWCDDPVRGRLFNTPHTLRADNPFTVFDFHGFTRDGFLAAVLISILAQRIEAKMDGLPRDTPKLFAFDEAWAMFDGSVEATRLLDRLYRTARSYGACVYTLTQSHHDITSSRAAQGIMANVGLVYLMRHQDGHGPTAAHFRLNGAQQKLFAGLQLVPGRFGEALLLDALDGRTRVLRYSPTPFDLWCDTSRPEDVALRERVLHEVGLSLEQTIGALAEMCPGGAPATAAQRERCVQALRAQADFGADGARRIC